MADLCSTHSCRRLWHSAAPFGTPHSLEISSWQIRRKLGNKDILPDSRQTLTLPKPLVEFANRPMILHQVESLAAAGVTDIVLAVNYRPDIMSSALKKVCDQS